MIGVYLSVLRMGVGGKNEFLPKGLPVAVPLKGRARGPRLGAGLEPRYTFQYPVVSIRGLCSTRAWELGRFAVKISPVVVDER